MKFLLIVFSVCIFSSCSNSDTTAKFNYDGEETLKTLVEQRETEIQWPQVKNESVASSDTKFNITIKNDMELFLYNNSDKEVYPSLEGFGSLNTSNMSKNLLNFISSFLESVQKKNIDILFFEYEKIYMQTVLEYNLRDYPDFTDFVIGEAFAFDTPKYSYEIPARMYFSGGYTDVTIFCQFIEDAYKIGQCNIGAIVYE